MQHMLKHIGDHQQRYESLTDKQRAILDAHAEIETSESEESTNRAKAKRAAEILGESINESYCSQVINSRYPELAAWRLREARGETIAGDEPVTMLPTEDGVAVHLSRAYVRELLESGDLPDELHQTLLDAVLEGAFDE